LASRHPETLLLRIGSCGVSILNRFKVVLLDMNGTFMFGQDRFGPGEDFAATYRSLGGTAVADADVDRAVRATYDRMLLDGGNPAKYDDFPQVAEVLRSLFPLLPDDERERIEEVIAAHELGRVPDEYADCLRRLARTHRLGLVSNLWSKKDRWMRELERAGVLSLFESPVFSSDHRSIKPSPVLFKLALQAFGVDKEQTVFVGDSLKRDVDGAKRVGLATVWIAPSGSASASADHVIPRLLDL
jgi:putative hydrolase of the HAD superfamily